MHVNCAMWTAEVYNISEEVIVISELCNFFFAFKHFRHNKCAVCNLKGATLICSNHSANKKCAQPYYHFPCAYASGKVSFQQNVEILCAKCSERNKEPVGLPIKFKDYHYRRFLIVKNLVPQCTNAFNTPQMQIKDQDDQKQPHQQQQW